MKAVLEQGSLKERQRHKENTQNYDHSWCEAMKIVGMLVIGADVS